MDHPHIHDLSYNEGEPLKFTAEFEVLPELNLSNYRGLEIERVPVEVKEEEVEAAIKTMQERMAQYLPVDRACDPNRRLRGDLVRWKIR